MVYNAKMMRGKASEYVNRLIPGTADLLRCAIFTGSPIHFYGDGLGKSTLCRALRELGVRNISEAGELNGSRGCWGIPDEFSGALIVFRSKRIPEDAPAIEDLPDLLRFWI